MTQVTTLLPLLASGIMRQKQTPSLSAIITGASQKFAKTGTPDALGADTLGADALRRLWDIQNQAWEPATAENSAFFERSLRDYPLKDRPGARNICRRGQFVRNFGVRPRTSFGPGNAPPPQGTILASTCRARRQAKQLPRQSH